MSPCSFAVEVQGLVTGAKVAVFADQRPVASGVAERAVQAFPLAPSANLQPRSKIRAFQTVDGVRSPEPDELASAEVMSQPRREEDVGRMAWPTPIHHCGRCAYLSGAFPGSELEIRNRNDQVIGRTRALHTVARLGFVQPIGPHDVLEARPRACGVGGTPSASPEATNLPPTLPPPTIGGRLVECSRRLSVGEVLEGAEVVIERRPSGGQIRACFDRSDLWVPLSEASRLRAKERLVVRQRFRDCDIADSGSVSSQEVAPLGDLPTPSLPIPPCAGSTRLVVEGLVPDATVIVHVNGRPELVAGASDVEDVLSLPALTHPSRVRVQQEQCGVRSGLSNEVMVGPAGAPNPPEIDPPPSECATVVRVAKVIPGATVELRSARRGVLSLETAKSDVITLRVPSLARDEPLSVRQFSCGQWSQEHGPVPARQRFPSSVSPPKLGVKMLDGDRVVTVDGVVPGAIVDVLVGGMHRGSAEIADESGGVPIRGAFREDDRVTARQRLCQHKSNTSQEAQVRSCRGRVEVALKALDAAWMPVLRIQTETARRRFREFGLDLLVIDEGLLDLPRLRSIPCGRDGATPELNELRQHRGSLGPDVVVVCVIDAISDGGDGCTPRGDPPFCLVQRHAHRWAVAHELVHAMGLPGHEDQSGNALPSNNLMSSSRAPDANHLEPWQEDGVINGPRTKQC